LQYEIIKDCCEKGYWWYDFNPSGGLKGTIAFKKSFGCEQKPSNIYVHSTLLVRSWKQLLSIIPARAV
jgi:lipid II:glycine glycyltransferase (peptidoglycan interpeptide bridge formation enzyme)